MGSRVTASPGFVLGLCLLYWADPIGVFWQVLLAAACHELGHWLAATLLGGRVFRLHLGGLGAVMELSAMENWQEALCAIAGPAVNLICFFLLFRRAPAFGTVSLVLAAFNLLPVYPLDGGRILNAALTALVSERWKGRILMTVQGLILGGGLALGLLAAMGGWGMWPGLLAAMGTLRLAGTLREEKLGCKS